MNAPSTEHILHEIWSRSTGKYVFVPSLSASGVWEEREPLLPDQIFGISNPGFSNNADYYFTPLKFTAPQRRKVYVGSPGVIFADLDTEAAKEEAERLLRPSVLIQSSPGHYHGYWFLDVPAHPVEWEKHARGFSQTVGADPGGWDITQVLRVPNTVNQKPGKKSLVRVLDFDPSINYRLIDFPKSEPSTQPAESYPIPDWDRRLDLLEGIIQDDTLLAARYWLTVDKETMNLAGRVDRSVIIWEVVNSLLKAGYSKEDTYHLVFFASVNKFRSRPEVLWAEIQKAASRS